MVLRSMKKPFYTDSCRGIGFNLQVLISGGETTQQQEHNMIEGMIAAAGRAHPAGRKDVWKGFRLS